MRIHSATTTKRMYVYIDILAVSPAKLLLLYEASFDTASPPLVPPTVPDFLMMSPLLQHCFSCSLWMRRPCAISSLIGVTPTSSKWQSAPSFILPLTVAPFLLHQVHCCVEPLPHHGGKPNILTVCPIVRSVGEASSNQFPQDLLYSHDTTDPNRLHCKITLVPILVNSVIGPRYY